MGRESKLAGEPRLPRSRFLLHLRRAHRSPGLHPAGFRTALAADAPAGGDGLLEGRTARGKMDDGDDVEELSGNDHIPRRDLRLERNGVRKSGTASRANESEAGTCGRW